jgi:hypothetical protein
LVESQNVDDNRVGHARRGSRGSTSMLLGTGLALLAIDPVTQS